MTPAPSHPNDHVPLAQLWILRALQPDRIRKNFVLSNGFRDDDLARFLDLHQWIDREGGEFDRSQVLKEMEASQSRLEAMAMGPPELCAGNCRMLGKNIGLSKQELTLLHTLVVLSEESAFCDLFNIADVRRERDFLELLSRMLQMPWSTIQRCTSAESKLVTSALAKWARGPRTGPVFEFTNGNLAEKLMREKCSVRTLLNSFVSPAQAPTLSYRDYPHIRAILRDMRQHLRLALREKKKGVNIFIHGDPGTGKSELSRVIAREMRAALYEVSFEDEDGDPVTGLKRLEHLRASQTLLRSQRSLLVFDEAEDVFRGETIFERSLANRRKAWMNHIFESNDIPTFWISNSGHLDPAFLRRFDFVLELKAPPRAQRARTYRRICGRKVSSALVEKMASYDALTAGVVAKAHEVARGICRDAPRQEFEAALMRHINHTLEAQGVDTQHIDRQTTRVPGLYDPEYLNCDAPLHTLPKNLRAGASCRICLYGPPGTGKTTLGHWLAKETDQKIIVRKASDLLGPYLGQTEQNIAAAFKQATEDKAILMIDEVDSFLQDRSQAVRSWEVQQVNELLTQMEHFDGTFIASTNLMDGIDQAALRRFDLKLRFGYLNREQLQGLLRSSCRELDLAAPRQADRHAIAELANATPGDFANCRRQARFRNFQSAAEFVEAVAEECRIKADRGGRKLGFLN